MRENISVFTIYPQKNRGVNNFVDFFDNYPLINCIPSLKNNIFDGL